MALTTRTLTNAGAPLVAPDDTPLAGAIVRFTIVDADDHQTDVWDAETFERVGRYAEATTDIAGEFTIDLWPNNRGNVATMYRCEVLGYKDGYPTFLASVDEDVADLAWVDFMLAGETLTPQDLTALGAHIADPTAAHAASAISFVPPSGMTATTAQAAITELAPQGPVSVAVGRALTNADHGLVLGCTAATAQTFTIPSGLRSGFNCAIVQLGAGQVTVSAGAGATLNALDASFTSSDQYAALGILNVAADAYLLTGATS
jgi:hypothetical protein